ncbi:MAG: zinc-binding dehydrogenase [Clostridiales Family XIII bacterium]|nr:zinc-binding dehydrogenase [Clostridiales Family XIII bacterium]
MKAFVVEKDLSTSIREIPDPKIGDYSAKVKTLGCGICGSDAKILHGTLRGTPPDLYPLVMGHEAVGEVVETGSKVTTFKIGDKVLCPYNLMIGDGIGSAWGAFAEYGTVFDIYAPGSEALPARVREIGKRQSVLPDYVDPLEAIMIITLRETAGAVKWFNIDANQSVALFGLGPVGLSFIQFMSAKGVKPIIALDVVEEKLELAKKMGADCAINAVDPTHVERIKELCPGGLDHLVDAVGITNLYNEAMSLLKENGQICAYGVPPNMSATLDWSKNPHYNFLLNFYQMSDASYEYWAHNQIIALIREGVIKLGDYISAYYPFEEMIPVTERFLNKEFEKKVIITF